MSLATLIDNVKGKIREFFWRRKFLYYRYLVQTFPGRN